MADLTVPSLSAEEAAEQVLWAAQEMLRIGLVEGTAGNIAARLPDGNAVLTPSSVDYMEMTLDDLSICDLDGNQLSGKPATSEKALHLEVLKKYPEVHATIHCHAKTVQMFAITHQPIPAVVEEFDVYVGGDVECTEYRETGSQELADEVAAKIGKKGALIMANHGLFTVGKTPKDALKVAVLVERTAEVVLGSRALGPIVPVPAEIGAKYASYYRFGRTGSFD
ncbi:MAG: class II aldolase/adducin family protein [Acidimicrobiia bacterium]